MSLQLLRTSIDKRGVFSVGASKTGFTTPWNRALYEESGTCDARVFRLPLANEGTGENWVDLVISRTPGELEDEALIQRVFCHVILTQLPNEGISEAVEALNEMWHFYRNPISVPPPLPLVQVKPAQLKAVYTRPETAIAEE